MDLDRLESYDKEHCWQYDIRLNNLDKDLKEHNITSDTMTNMKVTDFTFKNVIDKKERTLMKEFIERHEWLGNLSQYTTHWFATYYNDSLAGVILFNVPNAFSKLMGEDTKEIERLISRGACISWSPKNLASSFLMWSIKWMVKNTAYRLFTAYSDPTAKEIGTIYQACNFYYLGQKSGTTKRYINPYSGKLVSDRYFRQKTAYRKFAGELGIEWQKNWNHNTGMSWVNVPDKIEKKLRDFSKKKQLSSECIEFPSKHKYGYVLGSTPKETRYLRRKFISRNKVFEYPKER